MVPSGTHWWRNGDWSAKEQIAGEGEPGADSFLLRGKPRSSSTLRKEWEGGVTARKAQQCGGIRSAKRRCRAGEGA